MLFNCFSFTHYLHRFTASPIFGETQSNKGCNSERCVRAKFQVQNPSFQRTFVAGFLNGTIQAPPGVSSPAVPLPVLETMAHTDKWL